MCTKVFLVEGGAYGIISWLGAGTFRSFHWLSGSFMETSNVTPFGGGLCLDGTGLAVSAWFQLHAMLSYLTACF